MNQKNFDYFDKNPFQSVQSHNLIQNLKNIHEVKMNSHIWIRTDPIVQSEQKIINQKPISIRNENSYKTTFCVTEKYEIEHQKPLRKQIENPYPNKSEDISQHRIRKSVQQVSDGQKRNPILQSEQSSVSKIYPHQQRPSYSKPTKKF